MIDFKARYDGSGRPPRPLQDAFFDWLSEGWHLADVQAGQQPPGSGKSFVARTISLATQGHVVTPSNILIDQYIDGYRQANYLKGKQHYACVSGFSCADWTGVLEQKPCVGCIYQRCRKRAEHEPTFFNPLSLYYFNMYGDRPAPRVLVVDEAHQLTSMILMLCEKRFRKSRYKFDERCANEVYLVQWMHEQLRKLRQLAALYIRATDKAGKETLKETCQEIDSIELILSALEEDVQNYAIYFEEGSFRGRPETFLNVRPIRPPRKIVRKMLSCDKLILLSGTLLKTDVEDLSAGRSSRMIDLPSPIPKDRRPIFYRPSPFPINKDTDPAIMVREIEKVLDQHRGQNTIIHTTYDRARKMLPFFKRKILVNTPETKNETFERFKRDGGIWLAAGCAEGLDLKDDLCRVNIIPHLITPNLGDPVVKKRRALEDGDTWLALETLKVAIQQAGRSTRHEKDYSRTIVMDPRFPSLISRYGKFCPQSFVEAIQWRMT